MNGLAKTPPYLMTMTLRLKADVAADIRAHQSWNPHDIVKTHGLLPSLTFLKRDIGLTDTLDLFTERVLARLSVISEMMPRAAFPQTDEEIELAMGCDPSSTPANGCCVLACMHTMNAKAWATLEASRLVFGEMDTDSDIWHRAREAEELALAGLLNGFLRDNGLI